MNEKNESFQLETIMAEESISRCEDIDELRSTVLPLLRTRQEQWKKKINEIIEEKHFSKSGLAASCGVSRQTVDNWCKGVIPKNRSTFLRIGMTAGYNREQMDHLLMRYGQYPKLYAKSLEDCICIFVLNKGYGSETINKFEFILDKIKKNIIGDPSADAVDVSTVKFDSKLSEVQSEDELEQFISKYSDLFSLTYHKFYAYVKMIIKANYDSFNGNVYQLASGQEWSSSLMQSVSAIRQNKWYPTRNKIISLGLHLSLDHSQIDELLELAHMEPLYAKNIFESIIIFILEDASLNNIMDVTSDDYDPDELCKYAKKILEQLDIPEVRSFIAELPELDDER